MSFLAIIGSLLMMKIRLRSRPAQEPALFQGLKEGYRYAFGFPPIRYTLILLALMSFSGMPYLVLMPVFARDVLGGGPETLGFLMGASGVGALVGALYLASHKTILGLGKLVRLTPVPPSAILLRDETLHHRAGYLPPQTAH